MSDRKEPPLRVDWLLWRFRWILVAIVVVILYLTPADAARRLLAFQVALAFGAYNLLLSLLLYIHFFPRFLSLLTVVADGLILLALVFVSGRSASPILLLCLFPILAAALRFGMGGALLVSTFVALVYGAFVVRDGFEVQGSTLLSVGLNVALFFLVAIFGAIVAGAEKDQTAQEGARTLRELQEARDRMKIMYEMATALSATLNYQRVLEAMLEVSTRGFKELHQARALAVVIILLFEAREDREELVIAASRYLDVVDERRRLAGQAGLLAEALRTAEPVTSTEPGQDPELGQFTSLQKCRSVLCIPLRAGFDLYGVAVFGSAEATPYTPEQVEMLTAFCNQATVSLQNARLYQSLREERDRAIDADEEARRALARDLHDGPTQTISSVAMRLSFLKLLMELEPARVKAELDELERLARSTIKEIRTMLFRLRPLVLENQGLVSALQQYVERVQEPAGAAISVRERGLGKDRLDPNIEAMVFSIAEEAVNNARKHAQAQHILVQLARQGELLVTDIIDDGKGFDVAEVEASYDGRGSLGLLNMRERAALVGGELSLESVKGRGTRVRLVVPLTPYVPSPA